MNHLFTIDAPCGQGKTTAMINYINKNSHEHYVFVTPYLNEVNRIQSQTNCIEPVKNTKLLNLQQLLNERKNVVTTHALFSDFDKIVIPKDYTLIIDESVEIINSIPMYYSDIKLILSSLGNLDDKNYLHWKDKDYHGCFNQIKSLSERNKIVLHNKTFYNIIPFRVFDNFKDVYLLTYLYDSQLIRYYFDMFGVANTPLYVSENFELQNEKVEYKKSLTRIKIYKGKINDIGNEDYSLSKSWYEKATPQQMKLLYNNLYNFYRNHRFKHIRNDFMWTSFADYREQLEQSGYKNAFVACNIRATNDYVDVHNIAYLINCYPNPFYSSFFDNFDEDKFALSELLQFIFRSSVRTRMGDEVKLYVPSKRMRELLEDYMYA